MKQALPANSNISHYRIVSKIGAGGMGEVYLAEDARLRRKIALKVLPQNIASDKDRLRRFEQEAFAASGLNHPNILTIYEFGLSGETHFLAAEFVEGETLREPMQRRERLTIDETLETAIQTAAALSAAHEAKIIHRDIKPENIMIRRDHLVKVLDFGLAKLTEKKAEQSDPEAETRAQLNTAPGVIMGTVAYMSPEQARGKETDARSDIWSLGCVLYEMIGGRMPFEGETTADRLAAIINKNPAPLALLNENVPARLEEIVGKCLEKDRDERYQTTKDLLIDLRRLKKRLEFEAEKERSNAPEFVKEQTENKSGNKTQFIAATTDAAEMKTHTVSSAEYVVTEIKRHKLFAFGVLALLALAGIGFVVYKYSSFAPTQMSSANLFTSPQKLNFTRLATSGKISEIVLSPDGRYAAYATSDGDKRSIRLRQIATMSDVELVTPIEIGNFHRLRFTPDNNYLYYVQVIKDESTIYKIPTLGGSPTKIIDKTATGAGVSPDGKTIAFVRTNEEGIVALLQLANADGSDERTLVKLSLPYFFGYSTPAWSSDGKTIACLTGFKNKDESHWKLSAINVADGSQRQLGEIDWLGFVGIVWLPDGNLIVDGSEMSTAQAAPRQLWLIAPNAAPQRITNDLNGYYGVSATAKGDVLMAMQRKSLTNLWVAPNSDATRAAQVSSSSNMGGSFGWMPNGKFVYSSRELSVRTNVRIE